jgi:hypothetical protein
VNFAELPASSQWANLKYKGARIADVWIKPADEPNTIRFRITAESFQIPGMATLLTLENLLKSMGLSTSEVKSCEVRRSNEAMAPLELHQPLASLSIQEPEFQAVVTMQVAMPVEIAAAALSEVPESLWVNIDARWNAVIAQEVSIDTMRLRMETLRGEMESAAHKAMSADEKLHALNADVAQWTKAKSRLRYVTPKLKEYTHRATWAMGTPERKKLDEVYKNHIRPRIALPEMEKILEEIERLLKDRQILNAQGVSALQDGQNSLSDVNGTYRTLQANARANAQKKRVATRAKN